MAFLLLAAFPAATAHAMGRSRPADPASDPFLIQSVTSRLSEQPGLERVRVEADQGVVILSGVVADLSSKGKACAAADHVMGVRSVVDLIDVDGVADDAAVAERARAGFARRSHLKDRVQVSVTSGAVTLAGVVPSLADVREAVRIASAVEGAKSVDDQLEVRPDKARSVEDIAKEVRDNLASHQPLKNNAIQIFVMGGRVELKGTVDTVAERLAALDACLVSGAVYADIQDLVVEPSLQSAEAEARSNAL